MSGKERLIAGLLLGIAVAGAALIPRLLATPATHQGIALGPGPSQSVVRAPAIPTHPRPVVHQPAISSLRQAALTGPVTPAGTRPTSSSSASRAQQTPGPTPASPETAPPTPSPAPAPPSPPAAAPRAAGKPAHALPPGRAETAPGHEKTPPGLEKTPPGQAKRLALPGQRSENRGNLGSGHGRQAAQAPSHPVGYHHRRVGHLAPPAARAAPPTHERRPEARPEARGPRGKGSHGPPPPQVAHGNGADGDGAHGHGAHGNGRS